MKTSRIDAEDWWRRLPSSWKSALGATIVPEGAAREPSAAEIGRLLEASELAVPASVPPLDSVEPLSALTRLQRLVLQHHRVADVTPLSTLTRLEHLNLIGNRIASLAPLAKLTGLREIFIGGNPLPAAELDHFRTRQPRCYIGSTLTSATLRWGKDLPPYEPWEKPWWSDDPAAECEDERLTRLWNEALDSRDPEERQRFLDDRGWR